MKLANIVMTGLTKIAELLSINLAQIRPVPSLDINSLSPNQVYFEVNFTSDQNV